MSDNPINRRKFFGQMATAGALGTVAAVGLTGTAGGTDDFPR